MEVGTVIVAGHICLDIIPQFNSQTPLDFRTQFQPGSLTRVGPAVFSTGGPVSNTGLVLHKLGIPTRLVARVGKDVFGLQVRRILSSYGTHLNQGIVALPGEMTSYSVIISPPGVDRFFLHCPGANDTFYANDVPEDWLASASLLHFGYPPVMRRMYEHDGAELERLFSQAKAAGVTTSLDLCAVDPTTEAGRLDWRAILARTLPYVDLFTPSLDELLFMLDRPAFEQALDAGGLRRFLHHQPGRLTSLSGRLLEMGVKVALIKLGEHGAYLRTAGMDRLVRMGRGQPADPGAWCDRELWSPCFQVEVVGTTGSGDSTIAGFINGLLRNLTPASALTAAVAVGACNVEAADALSSVPDWGAIERRIAAGWKRLKFDDVPTGWKKDSRQQIWVGPHDPQIQE
jgi:sugar/nucleoside kinase (ribokinase family)